MKVELIYDADCPNVEQARSVLTRAFTATGIHAQWQEWDRHASGSPDYVKSFGSPTILIDGHDATPSDPVAGSGSCRIYTDGSGRSSGVPPLDVIRDALKNAMQNRPPKSYRWPALFASLPTVGVAFLPKLLCPLCFPVYAAILSALGLEFVDYTPYLLPLTVAFLTISLGVLVMQTRNTGRTAPLLLGVAASAIVVIGKFHFDLDWLTTSGVVLLIVSILLGNRSRPSSAASCPACVSG